MNDTPKKPVIAIRFIRRHLGRIVVGVILVSMVYGTITVVLPYQREKRIAEEIETLGGTVKWNNYPPDWMPPFVQAKLPFWNRIRDVNFSETQVTDAGLENLKGLTRLKDLNLHKTHVTDIGLEHLKRLTSLDILVLHKTQVTDAGLKHLKGLTDLGGLRLPTQVTNAGIENLKGLTSLRILALDQTQVTDAGLEHLKGLTCLKILELNDTQTTYEGREILRKALPNCDIHP